MALPTPEQLASLDPSRLKMNDQFMDLVSGRHMRRTIGKNVTMSIEHNGEFVPVDNPWFPPLSPYQVEQLKHDTADAFRHLWEGQFPMDPEKHTSESLRNDPVGYSRLWTVADAERADSITRAGRVILGEMVGMIPPHLFRRRRFKREMHNVLAAPRKSKGYRRHVRRMKARKS